MASLLRLLRPTYAISHTPYRLANVTPRFTHANPQSCQYGTTTPSSRTPFFRVSSLPRGTESDVESNLRRDIRDLLLRDEEGFEFDIHAIPSCYSTDASPSSSALLHFTRGTPQFLMPLMADALDEISVPTTTDGRSSHISIDRHFHGFTQLYNHKTEDNITAEYNTSPHQAAQTPADIVSFSIIAITGMDAHAFGSWMVKGGGNTMWLKDFLAEDMPRCRTMIYGYQSKLSTNHTNVLMDFGQEFFAELSKIRITDEEQRRPLFLVAHSYGGLLVAHCLIRAFRASEQFKYSMYKATYGILFFGTPHRGSLKDPIFRMIPDPHHPRRRLLGETLPDSEVLRMQLSDFKNVVGDRKIASFFETELTPEPEMGPNGKWARTGALRLQVDETSSLLQLPDSMEAKFPVNANHSNMIKFKSRNDATYTTTLRLLKEFERDAAPVVEQRYTIPLTLPTPRFMVPFTVSADFIAQPEILERLEQVLDGVTYRRAGLSALGGCGKSSIAVQYAQSYKKRFPDAWVFWVHANTPTRFRQSYLDIAKALDLPGRHDQATDVTTLVARYLDASSFRWLMILQSADDMEFLVDPKDEEEDAAPPMPLNAFIPISPLGSILVTSRDKKTAERIVGDYGPVITVPSLTTSKAVELLRLKSRDLQSSDDDASTLTNLLGNMPLAITQAGIYVWRSHPRLTISQYLAIFQNEPSHQALLLEGNTQGYNRSDRGVFTTWAISFERIHADFPNSSKLFAIMSFLDCKEIPDTLFTKNMQEYKEWVFRFEDDVAPLLDLALISAEVGGSSFDVHRLLQLAMRQWLVKHGGTEVWHHEAVQLVLAALPEPADQFKDWDLCKKIIPHAEAVLQHFPAEPDANLASNQATLLFRTAHHAWLKGDFKAAFDKCILAREIAAQHLDSKDSLNEEIDALVSKILSSMERQDLAIRFQKAALARRAVAFGPTHVNTHASLLIMANISYLLAEHGHLDESHSLAQKALRGLNTQKRSTGGAGIILAMRTISLIHERRGEIVKAEATLLKILKLQEEHHGSETIETQLSMTELADFYMRCHQYHRAIPLYNRALGCLKRRFGSDHDMMTDLNARLHEAVRRNRRWWWALLRISFRVLRIPFRLLSYIKLGLGRAYRVTRRKLQDIRERNMLLSGGHLYVRLRVIKNTLFGLTLLSASRMGWQQDDNTRKLTRKRRRGHGPS